MDAVFIKRHLMMALLISVIVFSVGFYSDTRMLIVSCKSENKKAQSLQEQSYALSKKITNVPLIVTHKAINKRQEFEYLVQYIEVLGLSIRSISFKNNIRLTVDGNAEQLLSFLSYITTLKSPIIFNSFELHFVKDSLFRLDMQVRISSAVGFQYPQNYFQASDVGITFKSGGASVDIDVSDIETPHAELIKLVPFSYLKFAGFIVNTNRAWALMRLPNNKIIHVEVGEIIGLERVRVTRVTEAGLMASAIGQNYQCNNHSCFRQ